MSFDKLLRKAEKALSNLDVEALVELYSPDFVFEDTASQQRITDRNRLQEYFRRLFSLPAVEFSEVSFFGMGDRAAGQWTWSGISLRSARRYEIKGASLFRLSEQGIDEEIIFYDPRPAYD